MTDPYSWQVQLTVMRAAVRHLQATLTTPCPSDVVAAYGYIGTVGQALTAAQATFNLLDGQLYPQAKRQLEEQEACGQCGEPIRAGDENCEDHTGDYGGT